MAVRVSRRLASRVVGVEERQQRRHVERHQVLSRQRGEGHAAGLDVQDPIDLGGHVSAAAPRELRVATEALRQLDELLEHVRRRRGELPPAEPPCAHRPTARDAASTRSIPSAENQRTREGPSGNPEFSSPQGRRACV
jgi:hypothetical protein